MFAPRGALVLVAAIGAASCGGSSEPTGPSATPTAIAVVSGNGQSGLVGQVLASPIVVRVAANNTPIRGATVNFAVTAGAASVSPATVTTDSLGQAKTQVTLGVTPGTVSITATVPGTSLTATFVQTVGQAQTTLTCNAGSPQTPAVGAVLPGVTGSGICLSGGAEYALVAFFGNQDSSATHSFTVTGKGAVGVTSASSLTPSLNVVPGGGPELMSQPTGLESRFDRGLREMSRRDLTPLMPGARQRFRQRSASSFNVIPSNPAIGSLVTLNANAEQACTQIKNRTGRIAAVSTSAIIVADTANPAGGFTDAEYLSFATMFDTLISSVAIENFGAPTDVDRNGKTVIFFTKEVNLLTPRTGSDGTIGGFFFERDLFPLQDDAANRLQGCAGSNVAEMFYVLVPDPQGVYSRAQSKADVLNLTPSTIVHEFQHLINASRRLYVNDADAFEDTWLNEGLSHIAEELLYYKVAKRAPRQNLGVNAFTTQADVDAFNNYQLDNNGRFELFIAKPHSTGSYAGNGELETRGATWHLLRYLADHRGTNDGDTWTQLVNTRFTGQANLAHLFGDNYMTQIRDWATSVFADDIPGVSDARFLVPSWNMRSIFPNLCANSSCSVRLGKYPLTVVPLAEATPANLSVRAGGAAYVRFSVPAGTQASIDWSANGLPVSALMSFTVVRTK